MRVHVAFTPAEEVSAPVGIVVDVLRATSTMTQALAAGYRRVLCCSDVDEARAIAAAEGGAVLAGERETVRIDGFDFGNSPEEFLEPAAETVVLTTTNGTRLLLAAAARCDLVLVGSLLNLDAVVVRRQRPGRETSRCCARACSTSWRWTTPSSPGAWRRRSAASPPTRRRRRCASPATFATNEDGLGASQSARNLHASGLDDDIAWCAHESVLDVVPRFSRMVGQQRR